MAAPAAAGGGPAGPPAILVEELRKTYGDVVALDGLSLSVDYGQVLGLLGPNGAGKTTCIDILSTLVSPTGGHAVVAGHDVRADPAGVRAAIALTGQFAALDEQLTGTENLVLFARLLGLRKRDARERARELLAEFDLVDAADRRLVTYSGGMRRRLDVAASLVAQPRVLFLDEPTTGMDPRSRQSLWTAVAALRDRDIAVVLTTQYLEEADALADRILVIDHGRAVAEGTPAELKSRVGGAVCDVVLTDPARLTDAAEVLAPLAVSPPAAAADRLSVPAPDGVDTLGRALTLLSGAGIPLADIALRRPSLDDVFLALTGHPTDGPAAGSGLTGPAGTDGSTADGADGGPDYGTPGSADRGTPGGADGGTAGGADRGNADRGNNGGAPGGAAGGAYGRAGEPGDDGLGFGGRAGAARSDSGGPGDGGLGSGTRAGDGQPGGGR